MEVLDRLYQLLTTSPRSVPQCGDRFYKTTAPQTVAGAQTPTPYGVMQIISRPAIESLDEQPVASLRIWQIQISVFGSYTAAHTSLKQVISTLAGYHDASGIDAIRLLNQRELWEEDTKLHNHSADIEVWESLA